MAKLRKAGKKVVSKKIPVEDVNGNKHVLKATVIDVSKSTSANIQDEETYNTIGMGIIKPPLSQHELSIIQEYSNELGQVIDAMSIGIEGFSGRLLPRTVNPVYLKQYKEEIAEERHWLDALIQYPNPREDFTKLRMNTRKDIESTGNAYWELVPSPVKHERYSCINKLDEPTMFIKRVEKKFTRVALKYVDDNLNFRKRSFQVKLRGFVQMVNNKSVHYKEFGDPRVVDRRDGKIIAMSVDQWERFSDEKKQKYPKKVWANEVYHFRIDTTRRTPYGMPRFTGNLMAIKGSRSADETNIITQQNNHVPSMAITVAGGQLTEGSIERIQEFVDVQIKGDSNYSKFLVLEGESFHDGLSGPGSLKIEIKPLSSNQHQDQLWQEYDKNNASKIRRSFRLPPIMVGYSEDLNRAVAQESERLAEKWVFNPAREEMDRCLNQIFMQQGFRFWKYKSYSPNVTNDEDIVEILKGGEKTGGVTPRIARMLLEDILNRELPPIKETDPDFDPDIPFSLSLAKLQVGAAKANAEGTSAPQGQIAKPPKPNGRPPKEDETEDEIVEQIFEQIHDLGDAEKVFQNIVEQPDTTIKVLKSVRDRLEAHLNQQVLGQTA